jgi:hypothetical protein
MPYNLPYRATMGIRYLPVRAVKTAIRYKF